MCHPELGNAKTVRSAHWVGHPYQQRSRPAWGQNCRRNPDVAVSSDCWGVASYQYKTEMKRVKSGRANDISKIWAEILLKWCGYNGTGVQKWCQVAAFQLLTECTDKSWLTIATLNSHSSYNNNGGDINNSKSNFYCVPHTLLRILSAWSHLTTLMILWGNNSTISSKLQIKKIKLGEIKKHLRLHSDRAWLPNYLYLSNTFNASLLNIREESEFIFSNWKALKLSNP